MWQPIETAPRNETFLAVLNCAGEQTICTMRWPVAEAKNSRPDSKTFHVERVTHWMPLPDLPGAQPAPIIPEGWLRAIDEALAIAHSGVVNADDTYEQAKAKLDNLIGFHVDGATDPAVNGGWKPIPEEHQTFDLVDLRLADGSVLCGCVPQSDGDYWWEGPSGEVFIDPKYAPVTHWRLYALPGAKGEEK